MSAAVDIRTARADDAGEIARLAAQLGYPATTDEIAQRLGLLAAAGQSLVAVADARDGLAGWIVVERRVTLESGVACEITGLVVDAARRRTGAGRALVAAAVGWARVQGVESLVVRSNVVREASHPFYEAQGFARRKTQHVYVRALRP